MVVPFAGDTNTGLVVFPTAPA